MVLDQPSQMPVGPMGHEQFEYARTPSLFGLREGWGPLILTLDTNLLIHLAQNLDDIGGAFGIGQDPDPSSWDDPIMALRDLFALWFWRDVRFYLPPEQLDDGDLDAPRAKRRQSVIEAFAQDYWERGGLTRATVDVDSSADCETLIPYSEQADPYWPPHLLARLPPGMDGVLIQAARKGAAHVFVTEDKPALKRADALDGVIKVMRPGQLLRMLNESQELQATSPYGLIPDLQSLAHFYAVIPEENR